MLLSVSRRSRFAFTLVELLVVLLIIAILVSLIGSAAMKAMGKIPEVRTASEISQMAVSLEAFKQDYSLSDPPPSVLILYEDITQYIKNPVPGSAATYTWLQKTFGKNLGPMVDWNGDTQIDGPGGNPAAPWILEGEQCLVFYLGGIPSLTNGPQGFSTNNLNPAFPSGKRHGPYFPFDMTRLKPFGPGGFFVYVDAWQSRANLTMYQTFGGTPYAYFSSRGINNGYNLVSPGDCPNIGAFPYFLTGTAQCMNPNGYQIISAGKDGAFGTAGWIPANGATGVGADDQTNFSAAILGAGQQ